MLQCTWGKHDDNHFRNKNIVFSVEIEIAVAKYTCYFLIHDIIWGITLLKFFLF